jgi:large subunit ribosomal protein L13
MSSNTKTPSLKASEVSRDWYVIDASTAPLGRVSTVIAEKLIGKHKVTFSPNIDNGDYVVVINAAKIQTTGKKLEQKRYYRHSGYIGSMKEAKLQDVLTQDPERVISEAVKGMLPKNKLQPGRLARLKVFAGSEHEHSAQKPKELGVK